MTQTNKTSVENRTMLTDLYQLTMDAAYWDNGKDDVATFELFVRKLPKDWGYFIANGIEDAVDYATNLGFSDSDIDYLRNQGFSDDHLQRFRDLKFTGEISAVREGTPITANTPILSIRSKRSQVQLLESMLLNTVNFQTLIASKASRVVNSAAPAKVVDFGLRRAQEKDAAMLGARACYIAGAVATSNVLAGKKYGIPISGTHAHSFVMSFDNEIDAFRAYVKTFPNDGTLLIDTYDTLQGARNATIVAKELELDGGRLGAVRLDSGDLAKLSKGVREILDNAGLRYVRIVASNDLNEYKIDELRSRGARIDGYGVGTEMITAKPVSAISGVYKLVEDSSGAKIKLSPDKKSYPGRKQVWRVSSYDHDEGIGYSHDVLALEGEVVGIGVYMPLLETVVVNGERVVPRRSLDQIRKYSIGEVSRLPQGAREVVATPYHLRTSPGLDALVDSLTKLHQGGK